MKKVKLGKTGLEISTISLGGLVISRVGKRTADEILYESIEHGVNYFDSATTYEDCQELFGNSGLPEKKHFLVGSKSAERGYENCMREIEGSLQRLRRHVLDIFYLHSVIDDENWEEAQAPRGALEAMVKARDRGLVRFLGLTGHSDMSVLTRAIEEFYFDVVMPAVNYLYRYFLNAEQGLLPLARRKNLGIVAIKPTIQGRAQDEKTAYRYVLTQGAHTMLPPGNIDAFRSALSVADDLTPLTREEEQRLLNNAPELDGICRQCCYCMRPTTGVDIPYLFRIESKFRRFGHLKRIAVGEYTQYASTVKVGEFLQEDSALYCPWGLEIRERLQQLHRDMILQHDASGGNDSV